MKAEAEVNGQTIEMDFSEVESRLLKQLSGENKQLMEKYFAERDAKAAQSKGIVENFTDEDKAKKTTVVEEFRKGGKCDAQKIKEQWTITIPKYATNELAGHLRDFVWVTDVVKGEKGEDVNLPN